MVHIPANCSDAPAKPTERKTSSSTYHYRVVYCARGTNLSVGVAATASHSLDRAGGTSDKLSRNDARVGFCRAFGGTIVADDGFHSAFPNSCGEERQIPCTPMKERPGRTILGNATNTPRRPKEHYSGTRSEWDRCLFRPISVTGMLKGMGCVKSA